MPSLFRGEVVVCAIRLGVGVGRGVGGGGGELKNEFS